MDMEAWVIQIEGQRRHVQTPANSRKFASLHKVPQDVLEGEDEYVFKPYMISIGPYHHGSPSCLLGEDRKRDWLLRFLERSYKPFKSYVDALASILDGLRNEYDELDPDWLGDDKKDAFLQMMVVDGSFLLEVMHAASLDFLSNDHELETYRHDVLLFDNQIPLEVLVVLYHVNRGYDDSMQSARMSALHLVLNFLFTPRRGPALDPWFWTMNKVFNTKSILNIYHSVLTHRFAMTYPSEGQSVRLRARTPYDHIDIPSATQIFQDAKIGIRCAKGNSAVSFKRRTLTLPPVVIENTTKSAFHNLILFERYNCSLKLFSAYIYFMNSLLKNREDSNLLRGRGVLITPVLSDEEVVELFRGLCKKVLLDSNETMDEGLVSVAQNLRDRYNKDSEEWRQHLWQTYLRSPWAIVGLAAAVLIFFFTAIQTIYTVLGYYNRK